MCDYSLELSIPVDAQQGETYTLHRFPTGTIGFKPPEGTKTPSGTLAECACMKDGTLLHLEFPDGKIEVAVFAKIDAPTRNIHHDGVRFSNGQSKTLQDLPTGTKGTVLVVAAETPEDVDLASPVLPPTEPVAAHDWF